MPNSPMHSIVNQLLKGDASCLTQDVIFNINQIVVALINKEPLSKIEQDTINDILHISNLIYNNTDRSILVLEDGVYDLLLEKYKRYNPNFQVGAEPVTMTNFGTCDVMNDNTEETTSNLFYHPPHMLTDNFLFNTELNKRDIYGNVIIDNTGIQTVSKRLKNTAHKYPQLVGTLHKAKFTLDQEAYDKGVYDDSNVRIFERDFLRKHVQQGLVNPNYIELVLELKYDGVSIEAEVTDRILSARTRGDTQMDKASDLTPILQGYRFTRAQGYIIEPFGMKFEAVVSYNALRELSAECGKVYVNPRNAIIGILGNSEAAKYAKYITLVPLQTSHDNMTREEELIFMNKYYSTGEFCRYAVVRGNYDQVLFQVKRFVEEAEAMRDVMPYMYDGVVVSYLNPQIRQALGRVNSINEYSIAIKFNTKKKLTRCRGVSYTVGADGTITPMIHYDPIEFYGMINTKSSGHSYARFCELNLRPNDILEIEYVNDVIAYVKKAQVPDNAFNPLPPYTFTHICPECGTQLVLSDSGKSVSCPNMMCKGRVISRVDNMISKIGIKGFSEETIKSLGITGFEDLMTLTEERASILGEKNAKKLIEVIEQVYNTPVPDYVLLGSLGFTGIANAKWKSILRNVPLSKLIKASQNELFFKLDNCKGIGGVTARTILNERDTFMRDMVYIYNMPNVVFTKETDDVITMGKTIRFSGVRDKDLENRLCALGHDCSDGSVTKNTDYLIIPFNGYSSSKVTKANEYNAKSVDKKIRILTLDEFKLNETSYLLG